MQPTKAEHLDVLLFAGLAGQVEADVISFFQNNPEATVVSIQYNYQGAEFDGQAEIHPPTHGVLIAYIKPVTS